MPFPEQFTAFVITVSDRSFHGEREDRSGPTLERFLKEKHFRVLGSTIVPDEVEAISGAICLAVDTQRADLVLTTGGTGLSPRDVTPEATIAVIDKHVPGFSEAMRKASLNKTPYAIFSRGVCGIRGRSIIINLPGSPQGALDNISVLGDLLADVVREVRGEVRNFGHEDV